MPLVGYGDSDYEDSEDAVVARTGVGDHRAQKHQEHPSTTETSDEIEIIDPFGSQRMTYGPIVVDIAPALPHTTVDPELDVARQHLEMLAQTQNQEDQDHQVAAIGSGRHQLSDLIRNAEDNKEALERSFETRKTKRKR